MGTAALESTSLAVDQTRLADLRVQPLVAGTRITVESILEKLAAGERIEQILAAHPRLSEEAIRAALAFAARAMKADVVYPTPDEAA